MTFDTIKDLREVPLSDGDFSALREEYGASKYGTHHEPMLLTHGAPPSFRLAAQFDLNYFHNGESHVLDWDELLAEMDPTDDRTVQERRADEYADTLAKG